MRGGGLDSTEKPLEKEGRKARGWSSRAGELRLPKKEKSSASLAFSFSAEIIESTVLFPRLAQTVLENVVPGGFRVAVHSLNLKF